MMSNKCSQSE